MSKMDPPDFPAPAPAAQDAAARVEELIRAESPPEPAAPRGRGRPKGAKTRHRGGRRQTKTDLRAQLRASESEREAARMALESTRAEAETARVVEGPGWWDDPEKRRTVERAISGTAKFVFDMIARRRGELWRLTDDELHDGAGSTAEALLQIARTFPEIGAWLLRAMELAAIPLALFVWYAIVDARLMQEAAMQKRGELPVKSS